MRFWAIISVMLLCANVTLAKQLTIKANIVNESDLPISSASIVINGQEAFSSDLGIFEFPMPHQNTVKIEIRKEGYYPRIHTFSKSELQNSLNSKLKFELIEHKQARVMFAFGGDVMLGRRYYSPHFNESPAISEHNQLADSKALLEQVKPYLEIADIAVVNLESQIADQQPEQRAKKSVTFFSKPSLVSTLKWAGIDYVTLGNNHTYDYLDEGLSSTLAALEGEQLPYSGAGFTEQQALKPYLYNINENQFALLGFVGWQGSSKIKQTATNSQGGAAYGSLANITKSVQTASSNRQIPIVQYHGSLEYTNEPTGVTEQRLKAALDQGAALAIAHHPHVTQGIELYNEKLIAYSMGNFIFDQNFSSTQQSFLLYVWLDNGKFHRAEIVPLYIKGYKPTPAIDAERVAILKRINTLSSKRNTPLRDHQGHGVIKLEYGRPVQNEETSIPLDIKVKTIHSLQDLPWNSTVNQVISKDDSLQYRLGTNLISGSNFASHTWFNAVERGFLLDKKVATADKNSNMFESIRLPLDSSQWLGMKYFRRVYKPSNPMTLTMDVKTDANVTINVYWQGRKTRQKLFDALENSPKNLIKTIKMKAQDKWHHLDIDFNSPRIGYRSYRVLVEFVSEQGDNKYIQVNNFSLLEWQTAFQSKQQPTFFNDESRMATHIGFNKNADHQVILVAK
ncbi:CapA family protein [Thalassotalea fusca]